MNYLAHLYLSSRTPSGYAGSLLGDFYKGPVASIEVREVAREIEVHRKVDLFTDTHELPRLSKSRVCPQRRRFAGIMVDVFYDHFLAIHWHDFADMALEDFAAEVYRALQDQTAMLPTNLKERLPQMVADNWLVSYRTLPGIDLALQRIARRIKRESLLDSALEDLEQNYLGFEQDFKAFFPQLITYVTDLRKGAEPS